MKKIPISRWLFFFGLFILLFNDCSSAQNAAVTPTVPALISTLNIPSPTLLPASAFSSLVLAGHADRVTNLVWSPDGSLLASSATSQTDLAIRLWNTKGQLLYTLQGHTGEILSLAWSPDGKNLASGSSDQTVRLWHPDGTLVKVLNIGKGNVLAVAWSPDGTILATGSIAGYLNPAVQLWRADGTLITTLNTKYSGGKFYNLIWSPDGQLLLGGATDYKLWRKGGSEVAYFSNCEHCTPSWGAAWSPNSQMFAIGDENGNLLIYDRNGNRIDSRQSADDINAMTWSPDGKFLAAGREVWRSDGTILTAVNGRVNSVAWSADGRYLAVAADELITIVRAEDGAHLAVLRAHIDTVNRVTWSPKGLILASASDDKTVRLWLFPNTP